MSEFIFFGECTCCELGPLDCKVVSTVMLEEVLKRGQIPVWTPMDLVLADLEELGGDTMRMKEKKVLAMTVELFLLQYLCIEIGYD